MLIRTQDKKGIVDAIEINTSKELWGKNNYIYARYAGKTFFSENNILIGVYQEEEAVILEIDEMLKFFTTNPTGIYEMR